jgi:hypothetical protein
MPSNAIGLRVISEPQWPMGGFVFARQMDRNYDVNVFGQPVSSTPTGNWQRGTIVRQYQPPFHPPPLGLFAYDPTDPSTWHQPQR